MGRSVRHLECRHSRPGIVRGHSILESSTGFFISIATHRILISSSLEARCFHQPHHAYNLTPKKPCSGQHDEEMEEREVPPTKEIHFQARRRKSIGHVCSTAIPTPYSLHVHILVHLIYVLQSPPPSLMFPSAPLAVCMTPRRVSCRTRKQHSWKSKGFPKARRFTPTGCTTGRRPESCSW